MAARHRTDDPDGRDTGDDIVDSARPGHRLHLDEATVRDEATRVFDHCARCRRCVDLCGVFPSLFSLIDIGGQAGDLTPAEQDRVTDLCHQCQLCRHECPYAPELHEARIDVPALMIRSVAMRRAAGQIPLRQRLGARLVGSTNRRGVAGVVDRIGARVLGARPASATRSVVASIAGISREAVVGPRPRQRFSSWFTRRPSSTASSCASPSAVNPADPVATVSILADCAMEYRDLSLGIDLVEVLERNGVGCSVSAGRCCGAALLQAGDVEGFASLAEANVAAMSGDGSSPIIVSQPTCVSTIRREYPRAVTGPDVAAVVARVETATEFLMGLHDRGALDTEFATRPATIIQHRPCHERVLATRAGELLGLIADEVRVVNGCTGANGGWGCMDAHADEARDMVSEVAGSIVANAGGEYAAEGDSGGSHAEQGDFVIVGGCHRSDIALSQHLRTTPIHPVQMLARAYRAAPGG